MLYLRLLILLALIGAGLCAQSQDHRPVGELIAQISSAGLDAEACYRVRDVRISRPDMRFYLSEGYVIFGRPVNGRRMTMLFSGEVEGGDAEVLVLPPTRGERRSLASFTESPTLNEHYRSALFLFSDDGADRLLQEVQARLNDPGIQADAAEGKRLAERFTPATNQLASGFVVRLVQDLLAKPEEGLFFATFVSPKLGPIDVLFEPQWSEPIMIGANKDSSEAAPFLVWSQFAPRGSKQRKDSNPDLTTTGVRIKARLQENLDLQVTSEIKLQSRKATRVIPFAMARSMRVLSLQVNGEGAEFLQRPIDAGKLNDDGEIFLAIPKREVPAGEVVIRLEAQGRVIDQTEQRVYFVRARSSWYPHVAIDMAPHEVEIEHPKDLNVVMPGELLRTGREGDMVRSQYRVSESVRMVGFNLGEFQKVVEKRGPLTVEVFTEENMQPQTVPRATIAPGTGRRGPGLVLTTEVLRPNSRKEQLARDAAESFAFFGGLFGPPPLTTLRVSPVPRAFGQGFPGLIYLTTASYIETNQRSLPGRPVSFDSELLTAHEVAHQWWGNLVYSTERADEWIMESLANYSALLYLEKKYGKGQIDTLLAEYRDRLTSKGEGGETIESTGPVVWGSRLQQTRALAAWRYVLYEKGTWIMHMLRGRMGKDAFQAMLRKLIEEYARRPLSTEQFREFAARFIPADLPDKKLELFFEQYVYGTGIPGLKLESKVAGKKVSLKLTQRGVEEDFAIHVPVEVRLLNGKTWTKWLQTGPEPIEVALDAPGPVKSVSLDPGHYLLSMRN